MANVMDCSLFFPLFITALFVPSTHSKYAGPGGHNENKERNLALRIYENAPRGAVVASLRPEELAGGIPISDIRLSLRGNDHRYFKLEGNNLVVDYPIRRYVRDNYYVNLEVRSRAPSNYVIEIWNVTITVTRKNRYAPRFPQDFHTAEVFRSAEIGRRILQLQAHDADREDYNSQIFYRLDAGDLNTLFSIENNTGWIRVSTSLWKAKALLHLQVVAMDTGSPPLKMTTTVTIILRDIAEPENLQVTVTNMTSVRICWRPPLQGRVEEYVLSYSLTDATEQTATKRIRSGKRRKTCIVLTSLLPRREYWVEIRALDGGRSGVPVRAIFETVENACTRDPCGRGYACKLTHESPGYRCVRRCGRDDDDDCTRAPDRRACFGKEGDCEEEHPFLRCFNGGYIVEGEDGVYCSCSHGFAGKKCQFHDVCEDGLCDNGATCETTADGDYNCVCAPGYFGYACENFDPCAGEPCKNGGVCINVTETEFECSCPMGFFDENCSSFNPCASSPCQNRGTCRNVSEFLYECDCPIGYHGYDCENYNPCFHDPCLFGGMCNSVDGEYVCDCEYGRYGKHCERLNICEYLEPCGRHAIGCRNITDTEYRCLCHQGWSGQNCTSYDPCYDKPCLHDSRCEPSDATADVAYRCRCNPPYYGRHCEKSNPCLLHPCKNNAQCHNTSESDYMCSCPEGYYGTDCEFFNSCLGVSCLNDGRCQNVSDTEHRCVCPPEYHGDRCELPNSCASNPCRSGNCIPSDDGRSHVCLCAAGYTGTDCQMFDPCASHPCMHGGTCHNTTDPSKLCRCRPGFHGSLCERYDACQSNPCRLGTCTNQDDGGYRCTCPKGMFGPTCQSTDPCTGNPCQHHGTCISTHGASFRCICPSGYYGTRCEHFNPCVSNPCHNGGICTHPARNLFTCHCPDGFQGKLCQYDIPCDGITKFCLNGGQCLRDAAGDTYCECGSGYAGTQCEFFNACEPSTPCLHGGSCIKTARGRYECRCVAGFFGERCESHTPCLDYNCQNNGTCVQTPEGDICRCLGGFSGERCEFDVDECQTYVCDNGGTCRNTQGSYVCECPLGFVGVHCENKKTCIEEPYYDASGSYKWQSLQHGEMARLPCPRNPEMAATRSCRMRKDGSVFWTPPDTKPCDRYIKRAEEALKTLAPFTNSSLALNTPQQVAEAARLLEIVLPLAIVNRQVAKDLIRVVDQILNLQEDLVVKSNASERILSVLDELLSGVQMPRENYTLSTPNVEVHVVRVSNNNKEAGVDYKPETLHRQMGAKAEIHLPAEVFKDHNTVERAQFSYFRNGKLFISEDILEIGDVISASIGTEVRDLKKCVVYTLENDETAPRRCVYYDKFERKWSSKGMLTVSHSGELVKCCSSHLTYFATVMDRTAMSPGRQFVAFLTSFSGTGISILFLFFVLLTYTLFRSLNREGFGQVVVQLALSMLLWNVSLLIGFNRDQVDNDLACLVVAVCTHYLTLTTLLWVSCTAHHVFKMLGRDYHGKDRCFCLKRIFLAWGLPMIPVAIPLGVNLNLYRGDARRCLMSQSNKWLYCSTYLTPCCLILFINLILFILVIKASLKPKYEMKSFVIGVSQIKVRGTCVIVTIMGICWLLGYFAERETGLYFDIYVWEYAFFGANTLLGIFVFLFYVLLRRDACAAWRNLCCRRCVSKRRRVAGKSPPGSTTMKSEGSDYHLVLHRKNSRGSHVEDDKMVERDLLYRRGRDVRNRDSMRGYVDGPRPPRQYHALDTDSCPPSPSFTTPRRLQASAHNHLHQSASSSASSSPHPNQFHHQVQHHQQSMEMTTRRMPTTVEWMSQQSRI